jgi:hypothetical protein
VRRENHGWLSPVHGDICMEMLCYFCVSDFDGQTEIMAFMW